MPEPRDPHPTADGDWRETEDAALRQERDALRAFLATLEPLPHGDMSAQTLQRKRQWCRVQRWRAWQQRRGRQVSGSGSLVSGLNHEPATTNQEPSP